MVTNPIGIGNFDSHLDVLKTRLQLQGELASGGRRPLHLLLLGMMRNEGVLSLYKGVMPSVLREGSYSTIRMGMYEPIKGWISNGESMGLTQKLVAGALSGMIGSAIANPTDLVKGWD